MKTTKAKEDFVFHLNYCDGDRAIYSSNPAALVGGLVGKNKDSAEITNCYTTGATSGRNRLILP